MRRLLATNLLFEGAKRTAWRRLIRYRCQINAAAVLTACCVIAHSASFFFAIRNTFRQELWLNVVVAWTGAMAGFLIAFIVFSAVPASMRGFRPGLLGIACHATIAVAVAYTVEVLSDDTMLRVTPLGLEPRLDYVYQQPTFMFQWWLGSIVLGWMVQVWSNRGKR